MLRALLLWAANQPRLRRTVPRLPFVRRAVRQYMPGEALDDALDAAESFREVGIPTLLTELGEDVATTAEATAVVDHYRGVIDEAAARGLDAEVSLKLTHVGVDIDRELALAGVGELAKLAAEHSSWVWIDMESFRYVDATLDIYRRLKENHDNVGVCLQAYLHRTPDDVAALLPLQPGIRLVKGAYREPADVALQSRAAVSRRFVELASDLVSATVTGTRVGLGTHDVDIIHQSLALARVREIQLDSFEIQMLYGIRMADQYRLAANGVRVRDLISYGSSWYPWYVRRLAEHPRNLVYVLRSLVARS